MSSYFTLDPDYKDFDFSDKDKLKFVTVYGVQHGNIVAAMGLLIGCSIFLLVTLTAAALDWSYWRDSQHTVAKIIACQATSNQYTYEFLAQDKTGSLQQFTGTAFTDGSTTCHRVGTYIRIEYLRYAPDYSHEITSEATDTAPYGYVIVFLFDFYGLYLAIRDIRAIQKARPRYALLKNRGALISGKISGISEAAGLWRVRGGYYIEVDYEFRQDTQKFSGTQIKRRDDLKGKSLPSLGSPVKVLFAADKTYVML